MDPSNDIGAGMFPIGWHLYQKCVQMYCTPFSDQVRRIFHQTIPGFGRFGKSD